MDTEGAEAVKRGRMRFFCWWPLHRNISKQLQTERAEQEGWKLTRYTTPSCMNILRHY